MVLSQETLDTVKNNRAIVLDLSSQENLGLDDMAAFAKAMEHNHSVTELDLSENEINKKALKYLVASLRANTTLRILRLNDVGIGNVEAGLLAELLKKNQTLEELHLEDNEIGDKGLQELGKALKVNHGLSILTLRGNSFGDKPPRAFADGLKENRTLTCVDLSNNYVSDKTDRDTKDEDSAAPHFVQDISEAVIKSRSKNMLDLQPATPEAQAMCEENRAKAARWLAMIENKQLQENDFPKIQKRLPGIRVYAQYQRSYSDEKVTELMRTLRQLSEAQNFTMHIPVSWREEMAKDKLVPSRYIDRKSSHLDKNDIGR
jgi:hypothetical protein